MTMRSYHGLFAFASILAGLAEPDRPLPKPLAEGTAAMLDELYTRGIDATEVLEAAGGAEHFETVARACLDMQAALKVIGIETRNPWRMLEHRHMLTRQRQFADRVGSLAMASALAATGAFSATVSQFALYESRCAREASLCACGPAGVAQLAEEHRAACAEFRVDRASPPPRARSAEGQVAHADLAGSLDLSGFRPRQIVRIEDADGRTMAHATVGAAQGVQGWGPLAPFQVSELPLEKAENTMSPKMKAEVVAWLSDALHPTGRCTCGGEGRCAWCEMDRRRERREARQAQRTARLQDDAPRDLLTANLVTQERKAAHRKARARQKARRGW